MFKSLTLLIVIQFIGVVLVNGYKQEITFYIEPDQAGDSITFRSSKPNLTGSEYYIRNSKSYCVTGHWTGFEQSNYGGYVSWFWYGYNNGEPVCRSCRSVRRFWEGGSNAYQGETSFQRLVAISRQTGLAIRHAGASDTSIPAISLYSYGAWFDEEYYIDGDAATNIPFDVKSYMSTGRSEWTFFEGLNFDGNQTCILASPDYDIAYDMNFTGLVRSVRLGCGNNNSAEYEKMAKHESMSEEIPIGFRLLDQFK